MLKELDLVVLTHDIENHDLKSGDVGTVVHSYDDGKGYEVEFVTAEGKTIAVLTLTESDIRPFDHSEILHSREVTSLLA
ncbi:DUF4926 domain-containing protein [candidate division KSB1 bacterium]|nr:DUF4926 domain-containing protein [candidate division KSB1 bacterium]